MKMEVFMKRLSVFTLVCTLLLAHGTTMPMEQQSSSRNQPPVMKFTNWNEDPPIAREYSSNLPSAPQFTPTAWYRSQITSDMVKGNPLWATVVNNRDRELTKELLKKSPLYVEGTTPLHYAVATGKIAVTEKLLTIQSRHDARDQNGLTPAHLAALHAPRTLKHFGSTMNVRALDTEGGLTPQSINDLFTSDILPWEHGLPTVDPSTVRFLNNMTTETGCFECARNFVMDDVEDSLCYNVGEPLFYRSCGHAICKNCVQRRSGVQKIRFPDQQMKVGYLEEALRRKHATPIPPCLTCTTKESYQTRAYNALTDGVRNLSNPCSDSWELVRLKEGGMKNTPAQASSSSKPSWGSWLKAQALKVGFAFAPQRTQDAVLSAVLDGQ